MRHAILALSLCLGACAPGGSALDAHDGQAAGAVSAAPLGSAAWLGKSIYFVVTDRFQNGDPTNDDADGFETNAADQNAWHGGDFKGLVSQLDYIAGMGFSAIWITPVVRQHDSHAYHGYWGWDWDSIDPHLGDVTALQALGDAAHAHGLALMIDVVANHTGRYADLSPSFPDPAMYHHHGNISDWTNQFQLENFDVNGLNDLAQENPAVQNKLEAWVQWLVAQSHADGLRVDTVKHVPKDFWKSYAAASGLFTIGEVLSGDPGYVAPYSHALSAALDYPLYFAIDSVFAKGGSARALGKIFAGDSGYADARLSGVFIDNHDQPRFLCTQNDLAALRLALTFAFTVRGLPILYYGTEQLFSDCVKNRADMQGGFDASQPIYALVRRLNALRARSPALSTGSQAERWVDDSVYAFERVAPGSGALVVVNNGSVAKTIGMRHFHMPDGTVLSDGLADSGTFTIQGGALSLTIGAKQALVLLPADAGR